MLACSEVKLGHIQLRQSRIEIIRNWPELPVLDVCRFDDCEEKPCIVSCPVDAISNERGIVLIDGQECNGCGECVAACPFGAIKQDVEDIAYKCDFCGGDPACVKECLTLALVKKE